MKMKIFIPVLIILGLMSFPGVLIASADGQVPITDLGTLGGGSSYATDINDLGQIVGYSELQPGNGETHAVLWQDGQIIDLGSLGGPSTYAVAINELGQVVGHGNTNGLDSWSAFLWQEGTITPLGSLGGPDTYAEDINDLGQVVGCSKINLDDFHAYIWENSEMTDLGTLGGNYSCAYFINEKKQIVGPSRTSTGVLHSFFWENGVITDLGTLGGSGTTAEALNDRGQVVGSSDTASGYIHAYMWENGVMTDLGTLGGDYSYALDINELGQIVGYSYTSSGYPPHAFLWENGVMTDLGSLGGYTDAVAINDHGQIVGGSLDASGNKHSVFWQNGTLIDLGNLGGNWSEAKAINELGQIIGSSNFAWPAPGEHATLWEPDTTIPANDNFVDATVIDTLPFNGAVNNMFATLETGEPQSCSEVKRTVWYKFTPNENMRLKVDVIGSDFADPFFSVYQAAGTGFGDLSLLHCAAYDTPEVFNVETGVTYYIQAGSINSSGGALHLNIQEVLPPSNDNFADAEPITTLPFDTIVDITGATTEQDEPSYCAYSPQTIWYKFTPAADATIQVNVEGSNFNTVLTFYQATDQGFAGLNEVNCIVDGRSQNFRVEAGATYYIQAGSTGFASRELHLSIEEISPPVNDDFENPTVISSTQFYDDTVDMTNASLQAGEPKPPSCAWYGSLWKTVWYSYTPEASGTVSVSVPSAPFAPVLTAYTGNSLTGLSELGCQTYWWNELTLTVEAGTTYYFQVGKLTWWDADGLMQFHLESRNPPANDNLVDTVDIRALPFTDIVNNRGATLEPNESQPCPWAYDSYNTVWYKFTPERKMALRADMTGSSFGNTAITLFLDSGSGITPWACRFNGETMPILVEPGTTYYFRAGNTYPGGGELHFSLYEVPVPPNDNFGNAAIITSLPFTDRLDNLAATAEPNEPQNCDYSERTVWYVYTPTENGLLVADMYGSNVSDTVLSIYQDTGTGLGGLMYLGCSSYGGSVSAKVKAGNTYYIQTKNVYGGGILQLNVQLFPTPPNDDFANAEVVDSLPSTHSVDISNATTEPNEPQYCNYSPKTVWYSFTPTKNMLVQVDMSGSSFWDKTFTVYQAYGSNITDLNYIGCASYESSVNFTAQANVTYYIQAGSFWGSSGNLFLNIKELPRPANDDFANAKAVQTIPFDDIVDTKYATAEINEPIPSCAYNTLTPLTHTVWYAFTPTETGSISASVLETPFTPIIAAYTGSSLSTLTQVWCVGYDRNILTIHVNAGTTYYFQVGNYYNWESGGEVHFHVEPAPQPVAGFYYSPQDPSIYDTVQFCDSSYDPGWAPIGLYDWDFGDGTTTSAITCPSHQYTKDGDYTVQLSIRTLDGRTASATQVIQVRTRDVAITKLSAPQSASPGQTRTITVSVSSKAYSETVQIDLYRSVPGGYELIGTLTQVVPARSSNRTMAYNFSYTFTSSDASIGKVTFRAVATIVDGRDIYPADNEAYSIPTKVNKRR